MRRLCLCLPSQRVALACRATLVGRTWVMLFLQRHTLVKQGLMEHPERMEQCRWVALWHQGIHHTQQMAPTALMAAMHLAAAVEAVVVGWKCARMANATQAAAEAVVAVAVGQVAAVALLALPAAAPSL